MKPAFAKYKNSLKGFLLLLLFFTSISVLEAQQKNLLVPYQENGKFGFIDSFSRKIVIPAAYDLVLPFREGLAHAKKDSLWGCINENAKVVVPFKYNFIFPFQEGLAFVKNAEKMGFVDTTGKEVVPLIYDRVYSFKNGLASVKLNNKCGIIDKTGKEVVPIKYDYIDKSFYDGLIAVNIGGKGEHFWDFKGGKWGFVDRFGNEVTPLIYDTVKHFINGIAMVKLDKKKFYINKQGLDTFLYGDNNGRYKTIRGFNMYYEIYGKGEPLLFIHGNGGSISNFSNQIPYFSKSYQVILVDSRAQGKSMDNGDSLSYEMMADDFSAFLDSLHVDSCYVIGWSDGGINGLLLSMRHPQKVKKMAITGANLWPDTTAVDPFIYQITFEEDKKLKQASQESPAFKNNYKIVHLMPYEPHISLKALSKIKCPVLVIGGDHDVILPKHTLQIAEAIPNSYLWILPNAGHSTPIYHKDEFNKVIGEFFKTPYKEIKEYSRFE